MIFQTAKCKQTLTPSEESDGNRFFNEFIFNLRNFLYFHFSFNFASINFHRTRAVFAKIFLNYDSTFQVFPQKNSANLFAFEVTFMNKKYQKLFLSASGEHIKTKSLTRLKRNKFSSQIFKLWEMPLSSIRRRVNDHERKNVEFSRVIMHEQRDCRRDR